MNHTHLSLLAAGIITLSLLCGCRDGNGPTSSENAVTSSAPGTTTESQRLTEGSVTQASTSTSATAATTETTAVVTTADVISTTASATQENARPTGGVVIQRPVYDPDLLADDGSYIKGGESGWELDWKDDFNGTRLNTVMWSYQNNMNVNETLPDTDPFRKVPIEVDKKVVSLDGAGHLKIGLLQEEDGTYLQGGVMATPAYDRTYGYFEIRCILPKTSCALAAFWLMPRKGFINDLPTGGMEVDIFETPYWNTALPDGALIGTQRNGRISTGYHYGGYGEKHVGVGTSYFPDIPVGQGCGYYDEFHVYGLKWTPEKMSVYVDGVLAYEHDGNGLGVSQIAEYMILSTGWNSWGSSNLELAVAPSYFTIDWVRVYKHSAYTAK